MHGDCCNLIMLILKLTLRLLSKLIALRLGSGGLLKQSGGLNFPVNIHFYTDPQQRMVCNKCKKAQFYNLVSCCTLNTSKILVKILNVKFFGLATAFEN